MTDQNQSLREDIAFVRQMAEAGQNRPMLGGQILVVCGAIYGLASLVVWYMLAVMGRPAGESWIPWAVSSILWLMALIPMVRSTRRDGAGPQQIAGQAWASVGYAIFAIALSLVVVSERLHIPLIMGIFPSVLMALYGAAWSIAATAFQKRWMHLVAIASFVMAPVNGWFANSPTIYLVYAFSLLGLLTVPGLYVVRQSRAAA